MAYYTLLRVEENEDPATEDTEHVDIIARTVKSGEVYPLGFTRADAERLRDGLNDLLGDGEGDA